MITLNLAPIKIEPAEPAFRRTTLVAEMPDQEYIAVSTRIGVNSIPLALAQLEQVIQEETLGIYDYGKVTAFLESQCARLNKGRSSGQARFEWNWHPVKEYKNKYPWGVAWLPNQSTDLYNKPIPTVVVQTMERILSRFPDAMFYVSDIQGFKDPFLAVTVYRADKMHVIERWDEPGFRS
jgi:hypothetical protein